MDKTNQSKARKSSKSARVRIEFDRQHLPILISALETYSRLQSGQIKMALDEVYSDRHITWQEADYLEKVVRSIAFPPSPQRNYDGHGGFFDQYNNQYDEEGNIEQESEEWARKKDHPHLNHPNESFGIGCKEVKEGTVAWEIKKAVEQYLHYERNNGYRDMGVDGDGALNTSGIPNAQVIDISTNNYWKPEKWFLIPKAYQQHIKICIENSNFTEMWTAVNKAFKRKPLPRGRATKIVEKNSYYYAVIEAPLLTS